MQYLTTEELRRLMTVVKDHDEKFHLFLLVSLFHGLRVSEALAIRGADICDGQLSVKRLKESRATLQDIRLDTDPLFDASPVIELAKRRRDIVLFPWSRQVADYSIKKYCALAGIHPSKAHMHALKHSIAMRLWQETHDLNAIQDWLGHKASSSTLVYMRANAALAAQQAVATMKF